MKKKILKYISLALTCVVIAGSSVTSPLTVHAEDYVTRYDYVAKLFSYDVCNNRFRWGYNAIYPTYTLYIKKGIGNIKITKIDTYTTELYINNDTPKISEIVYDFNPNRVIVDFNVLTDELIQQLDVECYGYTAEDIIAKKSGVPFDMTQSSVELWRMRQCPRSSFNDIELGSKEFAFEIAKSNINDKANATSFLFADYTGIVSGYSDGSFKPNVYITNEDAAVLVYRMLQNPYFMEDGNNNVAGFELPEPNMELLQSYTDGSSVSDYARDAVSVLIQLNFITPENNYINPKAFATTSYVNKIYANVNFFFKYNEINHSYNLNSDTSFISFVNRDRLANIYGYDGDK